MPKKTSKILELAGIGILLMFGLSAALIGQSVHPLGIYANSSWDIATDNNDNVYIMWCNNSTIYFGKIVNYAVTGQQTAVTDAVTGALGFPQLSVRPDGQTISIVYATQSNGSRNLKHAWRDSTGTWYNENIAPYYNNGYWYPAGAVGSDGTVHALYSADYHIYYTYKKVGAGWVTPIRFTSSSSEYGRCHMMADPNGGIHCNWDQFSLYLSYRYAAAGHTLDESATEYIYGPSFITQSAGTGDISVTASGTVHQVMGVYTYGRQCFVYHTKKQIGGSFSAPTCASVNPVVSDIEYYQTIGADPNGKVYVSWGQLTGGVNSVKLSLYENGLWTVNTVDSSAKIDNHTMPAIAMSSREALLLWRHNDNQLYLGGYVFASLEVLTPNGGQNWVRNTSQNITWSSSGVTGTVKLLLYQNLSLIGTIAQNLAVGAGTYSWTVGNLVTGSAPAGSNYKVRVQTTDNALSDDSDGVFTIVSEIETVSAPTLLSGPAFGGTGVSYTYNTGGALSSHGHTLQYKFDWGDGTDSGWLAVGTTSASHSWSSTGAFAVRAMARCSLHPTIESPWSTTLTVSISVPGAYYNSPAPYKVLPEVIWAPATGGGTWISEVQLTDVSGGSRVSVYYNTATERRGPFLLWDNGSSPAGSSMRYTNLLQTIDGLDSGTFSYYGTVGAVEFTTQDGSHVLHAAVRELNGNYAKTFSALSLNDANTAAVGRTMIVPNLTNNAAYRSNCGFFNPTAEAVTVELKLRDAANAPIGSTITRTLNGYGFTSFNPFSEAGVPYPGSSYENVLLRVEPTSGSGWVISFGATANNVSNDPAAHVAVQNGSGFDNGPSSLKILPEVIWAPATGGGTWISEIQVIDVSGGSQISVYYNTTTGRRGPFLLWNNGSGVAGSSMKYANLLQTIDGLDSGTFTYYGTVGAVEFMTQDGGHLLHATAREVNGNYAKTFPGLNLADAETADGSRVMLVQNFSNNASYRSTGGFFNPTADSLTVEFTLLGGNGGQVGAQFSKVFAGHDYQAFNPFLEAGVPYPGSSNDNVVLVVRPTAGTGKLFCFGATANNASNDPAAHVGVHLAVH